MKDTLESAKIPQAWQPNCYVTDDNMIYTPNFDDEGTMLATGTEIYHKLLADQNAPSMTAPTIEQRTAALESAMLAMLGGATNV